MKSIAENKLEEGFLEFLNHNGGCLCIVMNLRGGYVSYSNSFLYFFVTKEKKGV